MKTISGLFDDYEDASEAVAELEELGVSNADISIVASNSTGWYVDEDHGTDAAQGAAGGAGIGAVVGGAGGLLTGLGLMAIPGVGPVVAAGWLAATAAGAIGGAVIGGAAGGIVGALTDSGVSEEDAHTYAEGVRRGGTLVTAKVPDHLANDAEAILSNANSVNLAERRAAYRESGWTSFEPDAPKSTADEITEARVRSADRF